MKEKVVTILKTEGATNTSMEAIGARRHLFTKDITMEGPQPGLL